MGSKLKNTGVEFPDQTLQTTAASYNTTEVFYVSGTFTKPAGVTYLEVVLVGGGGGGGILNCGDSNNPPHYSAETNGGLSVFSPVSNPAHELGTHIAKGGEGGKNSDAAGQGGYLGEDGGLRNWHASLESNVDVYNHLGQLGTETWAEGGGQGGTCYLNNYRGGVARWVNKIDNGGGVYSTTSLNPNDAELESWSGGGGAAKYYLYTKANGVQIYASSNTGLEVDNTSGHIHGGDGGKGKIGGNIYISESNCGTGFGWKLSNGSVVEETDPTKFQPYNFGTDPDTGETFFWYMRAGNGFLGGGGGSQHPDPSTIQPNGGGGGGAGAGGGCSYSTSNGRGGTSGEIKTIYLKTTPNEIDYNVIIGKGGNGGSLPGYSNNNPEIAFGGGGGAQGICIIRY